MIEQRMEGLLPRPLPLSENIAANAALLARLTANRPPFPFPGLPPFMAGGKSLPPGMPPMLASLPQLPEIRARLLGLQFPPRQDSPAPQFSPPGFLGNFNFNRDGSDSPVDGKLKSSFTYRVSKNKGIYSVFVKRHGGANITGQ